MCYLLAKCHQLVSKREPNVQKGVYSLRMITSIAYSKLLIEAFTYVIKIIHNTKTCATILEYSFIQHMVVSIKDKLASQTSLI